jgi:hypothetical protein
MKFNTQYLCSVFIIIVFISGAVSILMGGIVPHINPLSIEGMESKSKSTTTDSSDNIIAEPGSCPDLLVQNGNLLLMYNTQTPTVAGVNPVQFKSMDEYIEYLEIQRSKGIKCPVLFLRQENNTQGNDVYRVQPSPFYIEGGLPPIQIQHTDNTIPIARLDASRDDPPFNTNMYPGFDPYSMDVGRTTEIDIVHASTASKHCSANAVDTNWCGPMYTNQEIERGVYAGEQVSKVIMPSHRPR